MSVFHSNDLKICIISGLQTSLSLLFVRTTTCPILISYFCQYSVHFLAFVRVITAWHVLRLPIEEGGTMAGRCARSSKLWRSTKCGEFLHWMNDSFTRKSVLHGVRQLPDLFRIICFLKLSSLSLF